jgi:hypothetical protein
VGIKLGVVVFKFFYQAVVASSRVITESAAQSNSQKSPYKVLTYESNIRSLWILSLNQPNEEEDSLSR